MAAVKSLLEATGDTVAGGEGGRATAGGARAFSAVARVCLVVVSLSLSVCVSVGLCLCRSLFAHSLSLSVWSMGLIEC